MVDSNNARTSLHHTLHLRAALPVFLVLLALPQITAALHAEFYVTLATRIAIFALAASSLNLILGFGGLVSFGHAAFVGAGDLVNDSKMAILIASVLSGLIGFTWLKLRGSPAN